MSTVTDAIRDSRTMLRRTVRYPGGAAATVGTPVVFLLLFVYVFGDIMGFGLAGAAGDRADYLALHHTRRPHVRHGRRDAGCGHLGRHDMHEGMVNRFRTMVIARASVLTRHVIGSHIQTMIGIAVVFVLALALGLHLPRR